MMDDDKTPVAHAMPPFIRPVRLIYTHAKCGQDTALGQKGAEELARDPLFYNRVYCAECYAHFPSDEFVWKGTETKVGS